MPLISVVIPVFNRSHLLPRALNSILAQTYVNYEVVIVDDCSEDRESLLQVIESYKSEISIIYYRHSQNLHGSAARNSGVKISNGEFIAFLDSDDAWHPFKLQVMLNKLLLSGADYAYSKLEKIGAQVGVFPKRGIKLHEDVADYLLVNGGTIQTSTLLVRTYVFHYVSFDEHLPRFQDYDFVISLHEWGAEPLFVNQVLTYMYDDDQSQRISNSYDPNVALIWIKKVQKNISANAYAHFMADRVVKYCIYSQDSKRARHYLYSKVVRSNISMAKLAKYTILSLLPSNSIPLIRYIIKYYKKFKYRG